jgi:hypothetical protein
MDINKLAAEAKKYKVNINFLKKGLYNNIANAIPENEEILYIAEGLSQKQLTRIPIVVTRRCVYMAQYGAGFFGGMEAVSIPISRIGSVFTKGGGIVVDLVISEGTVQHSTSNVGKGHAQKIISIIVQAQGDLSAPQVVATPVSQADELAKFKKLLDDGVLTQEEFDKKKARILGL